RRRAGDRVGPRSDHARPVRAGQFDAGRDRQRMGRGARAAQVGPDRAGGHAVRDHDRRQPDRDRDRPAFRQAGAGGMSTGALTAGIIRPADLAAKRSWRSLKSAIMTGLLIASVVAVALPLIAVAVAVFSRGLRVVLAGFPAFFVKQIPVVARRPGP